MAHTVLTYERALSKYVQKMKKQHYCYSTDITRQIQFIDFEIL